LDLIFEKVLQIKNLEKIIVVVNAKFYAQFQDWCSRLSPEKMGQIAIELLSDETMSNETRLGAVGDICLALDKLGYDDDVLIVAGDNVFEGDLQTLLDLGNLQNASVLGVHKFPKLEDVRYKFGVVMLDPEGRVLEFEEKPESPKSSMAATAIYFLRREDLKYISVLYHSPHSGELNAGCLISELLTKGEKVYCVELQSWYDIGTQEDLNKAREHFQPQCESWRSHLSDKPLSKK
jgi:glucose-1-phosphate thymidylyltransferase